MKTLTGSAAALAALLVVLPVALVAWPSSPRERWTKAERETLASMHVDRAGPRPADPSNSFEGRDDAAGLRQALFNDTRLSRNGRVSCASCHAPQGQFEDGKPLAQGFATGRRRTMPVMGAAHAPFLFRDGRKDSL
jgi:cytochrome c peroxidase